MDTKQMSLRKIAKELGVSHTLLSLWRQGKRTLSEELEIRYWKLVTGKELVTRERLNTGAHGTKPAPKAGALPLRYTPIIITLMPL